MFYVIVFALFLTIYFYGTRNFGYWKRKGIKHDRPFIIFGTNAKQYLRKGTITMITVDAYKRYPEEKVVGFYDGMTPALIIRDPEIIKRIMVTDFQHFNSRGYKFVTNKFQDAVMKNFFFEDGDVWRLQRQNYSPAFSSAKIKAMFPLISERASKVQQYAEGISKMDVHDIKDLMSRFTTDVIGACGFGLNMDCLSQENSQFRKLTNRIVQRNARDAFAFFAKVLFPHMSKNISLVDPEIIHSMIFLVECVLKERNFTPSDRNDFIDVLIKLKNNGAKIVGESMEKTNPDGSPAIVSIDVDDSLIVSQVFLFLAAGYETSSSTSSNTLHLLAFNPEYQVKIQREIDEVLTKYNNVISYDAVNEMKLLHMAFLESMRIFPSLGCLMRMCTTEKYTIPEINLTIDKGVKIIIPIQALQNDEKYFNEPQRFYPERFDPSKLNIPKFTYMPFGEGPRACIGEKLGKLQALAGIAAVLHKFTVEPAACSVRNPPQDPGAFVVESFIGGVPLKLRKR